MTTYWNLLEIYGRITTGPRLSIKDHISHFTSYELMLVGMSDRSLRSVIHHPSHHNTNPQESLKKNSL